ncbi:Uu.00g118510.m01.CDS01 [Anthostomella pinea]|uniref:ubiquitinyl hydrolase 1 n=1 Tax=Anthostomella pinea TaxID=933095 RepID=A0AAI8YH62_9PEZI|nr:Uu.00g118510.m01.CDS01 [Anthostomella pinea]
MDSRQQQNHDKVLANLFNHVALPAQLPQQQDGNINLVEKALVDRLLKAAKTMRDAQDGEGWHIWDSLGRTLLLCRQMNIGGKMERSQLSLQLRDLPKGGLVILNVAAQNAGISIYKTVEPEFGGDILFEFFEASPKREDVLASQTLPWNFPGAAVLIPQAVFDDDKFLDSLASFLEQASVESTKKFSEYVAKAGRDVAEDRNSPDPSLITSFLMAYLEANGKRMSPTLLLKRVRDDVLWFDSESPWRRLPYWLVLRVSIARYLAMKLAASHGRIQYKFFTCILHATVLNDTQHVISLEDQAFLKAKLCRRLFKLDQDHLEQPPASQASYEILIKALSPRFNQSIEAVIARIDAAWSREKLSMAKQIPPLPKQAEKEYQRLSLLASRGYLENARTRYLAAHRRRPHAQSRPNLQAPKKHVQEFGQTLLSVFSQEEQMRQTLEDLQSSVDSNARCVQLYKTIISYIDHVGSCYDNNTEQKSMMLLTIMEAWIALDRAAITQFPLLRDFHPIFPSHLMDVLQLHTLQDVTRARRVSAYLQERVQTCNSSHATVFDDPFKGCFAERYSDEYDISGSLAALKEEIESVAASEKEEKEEEWRETSAQYEALTKQIDSATCLYVQSSDGSYGTYHDNRNCPKCQLYYQRSRLRIRVFESPLPKEITMAKAVVFELNCPSAFAAYRAATWKILSHLAIETQDVGTKPKVCIEEYSELQHFYSTARRSYSVTLASTAKSFLMTHWATKSFPVELDQVCLPNGLRLGYYDKTSCSWPGRKNLRASFAHHCRLSLPKSSPFASMLESRSFAVDGNGPSSYEIVASQSACPSGNNPHEYMAVQGLLSGKCRRWINILRELGSSNINLSTESAVLLMSHLALQCGPWTPSEAEGAHYLGVVHSVFRDAPFCKAMLQQLTQKLENIAFNWRETHLMEIIILLILRLVTLLRPFDEMNDLSFDALRVLARAREITLGWVRMLRKETYSTSDSSMAQNCQSYLLWAALLCKRTYGSYLASAGALIDGDSLASLCECLATVFDNIPDNIKSLGPTLTSLFVRDLRMMYDLRIQIRDSIQAWGERALLTALHNLWPASRSKDAQAIICKEDCWVELELIDVHEQGVQVVGFNYMFGNLLVEGQPLGKLPTDPQSMVILEELFGSQTSLKKYPSSSPGMTHALTIEMEGFQTHIGYDSGATIIRAIKGSQVLELVPRDVFIGKHIDLPASLIVDCVHWLDMTTGILEIRPKSWNFWRSHPHNWKLNIETSVCSRTTFSKAKETLIDTYSPLFGRVAKIFEDFELPRNLTIYQPERHSLTVEMPRMQLRWHVNDNQMLQCPHLSAQIDPRQSVDTWYGLDSKLVLTSIKNPTERFILVPLGSFQVAKRGCHVQVVVDLSQVRGHYLRFSVNATLGRIDCGSEPVLFYKKAEIHALTSFILPDPLTGLTGTESAMRILTSGVCQPWAPLAASQLGVLSCIAKLSPRREYYPEDRKVMKKEFWVNQLPVHCQRDEYRIIVDRIISQSTGLSKFYPEANDLETQLWSSPGDSHLNLRSLHRRQLYARPGYSEIKCAPCGEILYVARDSPRPGSLRYTNVLETVSLIRDKPSSMTTVRDLAMNLSQSLSIKGYAQDFSKITLSDRLLVDVRQEWGPLVNAVKSAPDGYNLMYLLGLVSFKSDANMALIKTLIAWANWDQLKSLDVPEFSEYCSFRPHQLPQLDVLVKLIEPFRTPPPEDPPLFEFASSKDQRKLWQSRKEHERRADADCRKLAQFIVQQWPTSVEPDITGLQGSLLIDVPVALESTRSEWRRLYYNHEFHLHLKEVQQILDRRHSNSSWTCPEFVASEATFSTSQRKNYRIPMLEDELMKLPGPRAPSTARSDGIVFKRNLVVQTLWQGPPRMTATMDGSQELDHIVDYFSQSESSIHTRYAADLKRSLAALKAQKPDVRQAQPAASLPGAGERCQAKVSRCFDAIRSALETANESFSQRQVNWLHQGQLWPAVTRVTVLEQLRSAVNRQFGSGMKESIIRLGLSITEWQRELRIEAYRRSQETARLEEEQNNVGHTNWKVEETPDWLLLEIESNLLIREKQVEVAQAIIAPTSGASSVLQLNMGEGKTSIIIPQVAVLLADGKSLVRVSVPRALLQQTAQLLHARLGGLVGREISHVPFSRRTSTKEDQVKLYQRLHREILKKGGVMLCLPEHQMSFMLSGLQRILDKRIPEANMMVRVQKWLQSCARDVLDECDHTLAVKTQLIYPSGSQLAVDGHPHRWLVVQQLLGLVDMHLFDLADGFSRSVEVVRRPQGGFPFVFFLRPDVEEELVKRLTYDVCRGARGIIPIDSLEQGDRLAIKEYLSGGKVRPASIERISKMCPDRPHIRQVVYLLRGLFVHRILVMTLKKRYGVQYGIHPSRDPVAVPFHAKGVPSEQSEFGHIDVAILLTCLATYYGGISISQTRQALEGILKSDDPASEYDKWAEDENFPEYLRDWHSINVDDPQQMTQIWNCVRYKVLVIDYYMNNFVFPYHAKQFHNRLQSNGWDIPLFSPTQVDRPAKGGPLKRARGLTTGFSGTNDIKPLLPLTIKQDDLPSLLGTNAEVLTYLLHERSRRYLVLADMHQKRLTERGVLQMLRRTNIRVLIDAGACILEYSNLELAKEWLKVDGRATVALYFEGDRPFILSKQGVKTPLLASPYADNLQEVLVYLDEAHTRGTDLKFAPKARAALTLGLGQTKDHTVQAAMRLRQLGTTQSVTFFAPPEVNQSIRDFRNKKDDDLVDSSDVIYWLINNTCDGIEQLQPLYYSQGVDFCNRMQAAEDSPDFLVDSEQRAMYVHAIRQTERQTLQQLYGPQTKTKANTASRSNPKLAEFSKELETRKKAFQDTGQAVHASALQEVEQERETEREVEAVRQVKKPPVYQPYSFPGLHRDLETFARTGRVPAGSDTFVPIFTALARTGLGKKHKVNRTIGSSQLFISTEFEKTVKFVIESANDNFMRPVQWTLYCAHPEAAIVVTPEEAECLISLIRKNQGNGIDQIVHLLTYAAPVTRRMMQFNRLDYYAIPSLPTRWRAPNWLSTELGFFAGRLYFEWEEYDGICKLLGIDEIKPLTEESGSSEGDSTTENGTTSAIDSSTEASSHAVSDAQESNAKPIVHRPKTALSGLTPKPYTFTQEYLSVRRRGQEFSHTPMGFLVSGKPLNENHPFFRAREAIQRSKNLAPVASAQVDGVEDDVVIGDVMDMGDYDPAAELKDHEAHDEIQYDESEFRWRHQSGSDGSDTEPESSGKGEGRKANSKRK